jgi:hypothetical protein
MAETYYRLHRADALTFDAGNAWSAAWGETFSVNGAAYECRTCDATGEAFGEPCRDCDNGWIDAEPGYSCCSSATELLTYFSEHVGGALDAEPVVVFEGQRVGSGLDGEPLVIPTTVVRWTTIGQIRTELA